MSSEDHLIVELHEGARIQIHLARWGQLQIKVELESCMVDLKVHGERQQVFTMQSHQRRHPLTITIPDFLRGKVRSNATLLNDWAATQHGHLTRHHENPGKSIEAIHKHWQSGDPLGYAFSITTKLKLPITPVEQNGFHRVAKLLQVLETWDTCLWGHIHKEKLRGQASPRRCAHAHVCPWRSPLLPRHLWPSIQWQEQASCWGLFFWLFTGQLAAKCPFWPHRRHCRAAWARCCGCAGFIGGLSYLYMLLCHPLVCLCPSCP